MEVKRRTGKTLTIMFHTKAWKKIEVRPQNHATQRAKLKQEYCYYNVNFNRYTYNYAWVERLVKLINDDKEFKELKEYK